MVLPKGLKNYTIPKTETFIHKKTCVEWRNRDQHGEPSGILDDKPCLNPKVTAAPHLP